MRDEGKSTIIDFVVCDSTAGGCNERLSNRDLRRLREPLYPTTSTCIQSGTESSFVSHDLGCAAPRGPSADRCRRCQCPGSRSSQHRRGHALEHVLVHLDRAVGEVRQDGMQEREERDDGVERTGANGGSASRVVPSEFPPSR
jgi:hypothetical protein